jgi:DNA topoisomerase-1
VRKVNDTYILRDGASGLFLAASQFPKNRETRAPLVLEIVPHKDEIDPKYHFLCEAPQKDPDGRPAVIRYSRKTKEQYVQSEVDGKPTGWKAFYDGGVEGRRQALIERCTGRSRMPQSFDAIRS